MLLSNISELRLYNSAHALDDLEPLKGIIDNVEHDILVDKLGKPLYRALCDHYKNINVEAFVQCVLDDTLEDPWDILLRHAQAVVANEAVNHAIALHLVSLNNSGLNMGSAEDYAVANKEAVETTRKELYQLTHIAVNALLEWLEDNAKKESKAVPLTDTSSDDDSLPQEEQKKPSITYLWQSSAFFWQTVTLLIPSAVVLRQYWDTFDNREKFVRMIPDIRYAQDIISDEIGEEWLDYLIKASFADTTDAVLLNIIDRLRKSCCAYVESRTEVLSINKERRSRSHDEALKYLHRAVEYMQVHQSDLDDDALETYKTSPLYIAPLPTDTQHPSPNTQHPSPDWRNNRRGNKMFVMPRMKK